MKVYRLLSFLILLTASQAWGQSQAVSTRLIKYDPLFWKSELNLNSSQSNRIREINYKFYEEIQDTYQKNQDDRSALTSKISESLKNRSQLIWETLEPKQRKKLEKIINGNYHI